MRMDFKAKMMLAGIAMTLGGALLWDATQLNVTGIVLVIIGMPMLFAGMLGKISDN